MAHRHFPRNKIPLPITLEAWLLLASVLVAILMVKTHVFSILLENVQGYDALLSFLIGLLFSSGIVTAPAIVAIGEGTRYIPIWELAAVGAAGSVCGDLLLFRFVRSQLIGHLLRISLHPRIARLGKTLAAGPFWWIAPVLGAVVIASPLPDELGLLMMGLSTIRMSQFIPLAYAANVVGIYIVAIAAKNFL